MFEHYIHQIVCTAKGQLVLIDVAYTPDCGWEGAYALLDEEIFSDWWVEWNDGEVDSYTDDDIMEWGAEAEAFSDWVIVSNHHRTPEAAEKKLRKVVATL